MTTPRNDEIQAALVAYLKSKSVIYNELITPDNPIGYTEIREDNWKGTEFDYPNIRVRMISNEPITDEQDCSTTIISVSFMAFSQEASSHEADKIAGIIGTSLSGKTFIQNGVQIYLRAANLIPAVSSDRNTWRSECLMQGAATQ
jgi:hypothetical protein